MKQRLARPSLALAVALMAGSSLAAAAALHRHAAARGDDGCDGNDDRPGRHCEVRELTLPAPDRGLEVDAGPNGGIQVVGADRTDVRLRAKVGASAETEEAARALVEEIRIVTSGRVHAEGPKTSGERGWWVSYELEVPTRTDLLLRAMNGGISVDSVSGALDFKTMNGGIRLSGVGGRVRGRTTNGGLDVRLEGSEWSGEALDVETTNGGVTLSVPAAYNAHLETSTVNGGMRIDFPITVQGRVDRRISTDLGRGGPPLRVVTTNGGVVVRKR